MSTVLISFVSCNADTLGVAPTTGPEATPIRTVPPETTLADGPATTPLATAYPTLPAVTAAPPLWSPRVWQPADVDRFIALVQEELDSLGADAVVYEERGFALLDNGTKIPLAVLAAQIAALPTDTWRGEISTFLLTALRPTSPDDLIDYLTAAPLLRVRVGTLTGLQIAAASVISQVIAGDLLMVVVIDGPDRVAYVSPAQADLWAKTPQEVLLVATAQTLALRVTPVRDGVYTSLTDTAYGAARVIDPKTVVIDIPPDGLVIVVPSSRVFLSVAVDASLDETTLIGLAKQARQDFGNASDPVSEDLYWWHDGVIDVVKLDGEQLVLPLGLQQLLGTE